MPARRSTKRAILTERLPSLGKIDEHAWNLLKQELAPISDSYLRSLLIATGHPLSPLIEGVHTSDLDQAERTLRALAEEYESADIGTQENLPTPRHRGETTSKMVAATFRRAESRRMQSSNRKFSCGPPRGWTTRYCSPSGSAFDSNSCY